MPGNATISVRTDPDIKKKADKIFKKLGISASDAINMFYNQVIIANGIPFDLKLPNDETLQSLIDIERGRNLIKCKNAKDMFDKLGI